VPSVRPGARWRTGRRDREVRRRDLLVQSTSVGDVLRTRRCRTVARVVPHQ
jgi:hypothetical protein